MTSQASPTPLPTSARNVRSRRSSSGIVASSLKMGRTNERTGTSIETSVYHPVPSMRTHKRAVLAVFALGVLLRLPTFSRPLLSDDEAIYATTADALNRGDLLFRDV